MENYKDNTNPWKGLNFYKEGEIIYGRNREIESLSHYIINNTQTVLYGKSGIGKSSILNAGIYPIARQNGLIPVGIRLDHNTSVSYLQQIKNAVANSGVDIHELLPVISESDETLWEYLHRNIFFNKDGNRTQLLLVFDQFEEIFTLQKNENKKRAFFEELADLLNDVTPLYIVNANNSQNLTKDSNAKEVEGSLDDIDIDIDIEKATTDSDSKYLQKIDYHVVFTLREDFLSFLERYTKFIPVMKSNRYALLPLNEEQAAEIITKPKPGLVSVDVAKLIIQKVTGRIDFSLGDVPEIEVDAAILSLYLSRIYIKKKDSDSTITTELVNQFSDDIIKDFYEESVANIPVEEIERIEDRLLTYDGRRNNVSKNDLVSEGVSERVLDILVDEKKLLRQFSYQNDIRVEFMHDILCPVVDARISMREEARRKEEERLKQEEEKEKYILEERAKREQIEKEAEAEKTRLREETIRIKKRNRRRFLAIGFFLAFLALGSTGYWFWYEKEYRACFASFTTKDGWPIGIGKELKDDNDKKQMPVFYQLVRKGYKSKNTRVNVLNNHKDIARNKFKESPLVGLYETDGEDEKAKEFAVLQRQTAYWIYTPDNDGNILRKTAYAPDGKELYAVQYFRSSAFTGGNDSEISLKKQFWANYVDKDGKSMRVRDNGADRVRILNDSTGFVVGYQFYSETGTPQPNDVGAYGYRYKLGKDGRCLEKNPVDAFGDLLVDKGITYEKFDEYGRWTSIRGGEALYGRDLVIFSMTDRTDSLKFSDQGELSYRSESRNDGRRRTFQYEKGKIVSACLYKSSNSGTVLVYSRIILPKRDKNIIETQVYWADSITKYRIKRETFKKDQTIIAYYKGNTPDSINEPLSITTKDGQYHKIVSDTIQENELTKVTVNYLDEKGNPATSCIFNRDVSHYNSNHEMIKHYVYKDNILLYSYLNEYEDGQIVSQSVIGVDGTRIRFAQWDKYNMCYYKMRLIYNFSNTLVAIKGVNEFGEVSLITVGDYEYILNTVPSYEMRQEGNETDIYGIQVYSLQTPLVDKSKKVEYIHIIDKNGSWYKAGLKDGDLIVNDNNPFTIARAQPDKNTYEIKTLRVQDGQSGAEHYAVYFTEKEYSRYTNALKKYKNGK